jgi:hypothetical protein
MMRGVLTAVCGFTILASAWLVAMFLILRHPGFEWRAALSFGLMAASLATLVAVRARRPAAWLRTGAGAAGLAVLVIGAAIFIQNLAPHAGFEGYTLVISFALIAQGAMTLGWLALRRPQPIS